MKKTLQIALTIGAVATATVSMASPYEVDPEKSRQQLVEYFKAKNPKIAYNEYVNGAYNYSADKKSQWEAVEEFPPYLDAIDDGEAIYNKDQAVYDKCFGSDITKVRVNFPRFNEKTQKVETLEEQINKCRKDAGLKPFKWKKGNIAKLSAFYAYQARGQKINVKIESEGAKKAFLAGQAFYIAPKGQLGLSCAKCHTYNAGRKVRANILSPNLGHTSHFPVFRAKWQSLGTLHRRYGGCNKNMRVKPQKAQSDVYKNLEFFQAYMDNGLILNGPGYRE